jgi:hypothetical protein
VIRFVRMGMAMFMRMPTMGMVVIVVVMARMCSSMGCLHNFALQRHHIHFRRIDTASIDSAQL